VRTSFGILLLTISLAINTTELTSMDITCFTIVKVNKFYLNVM